MTEERTETFDAPSRRAGKGPPEQERRLSLVVVWSRTPEQLGEVLLFPRDGRYSFGRGETSEGAPRARLSRQRPGQNLPGSPLENQFISRQQLRIDVAGGRLRVTNLGKTRLLDRRQSEQDSLELELGQTFAIDGQLVFLCVERPLVFAELPKGIQVRSFEFAGEDAFGLVGESELAWRTREHLAFLGDRMAPVLILGPSGSGKELAARAIHGASSRASRKLVARNAATIPESLAEAELFGTAANYPSLGMPERPGLVGEAQNSTLFLDEIGELPEVLQARLLRLLDTGGDYQRLGDARTRHAEVRVVAATNRSPESLRTDLAARFKLRLTLPGLGERLDDVPMIWRALAQRIAQDDAPLLEQFFPDKDVHAGPRQKPELVQALLEHRYTGHVRELERFLWCSLQTSRGDALELTPELRAELASPSDAEPTALPDADTVRAALERQGGVQEKAWRDLGLTNRYVLKRLIKKYGLSST